MSVQDQLLDRIEALSTNVDMPIVLNDAEKKQVDEQLNAITQQAQAIENVDERFSFLISQLRKQLESTCEFKRSAIHHKQRIERLTKEKDTVSTLSKGLSLKNAQLKLDLLKQQQAAQQSLSDLRNKFEVSLTSIQKQLASHNTERESQAAAQKAMKNHIDKMVEFDKAREAQNERLIHTKDLELSIKENEKKQEQMKTMQAEMRLKECINRLTEVMTQKKEYSDQLIEAMSQNKEAREQLSSYASKFSEVQTMMDQSNQLMNDTKKQTVSLQKQTIKAEKEKLAEMQKNNANAAALIKLVQEKKELAEQLDRSDRQKNMLQSLCKQLQAQIKSKSEVDTSHTSAPQQLEDDELLPLSDVEDIDS